MKEKFDEWRARNGNRVLCMYLWNEKILREGSQITSRSDIEISDQAGRLQKSQKSRGSKMSAIYHFVMKVKNFLVLWDERWRGFLNQWFQVSAMFECP